MSALDHAVASWMVAHRTGWATGAAEALMAARGSLVFLALAAVFAGVVAVRLRAYRPALAALVAVVLASAVVAILKPLFGRDRPPSRYTLVDAAGYAFPSAQACQTAAVAVAVLLTADWGSRRVARLAGLALAAAVATVGVAMVYLGAHWATDVLAGWVLGVALGAAVAMMARRLSWRGPDRTLLAG